MSYTHLAGLSPVIFRGCQELLKLQEMEGRKPPAIKYEFYIEDGTVSPQLSDPDQPTIKPTIEKPIVFSSTDTGTSTQDIHAINDVCDFHDCAGVLG